MSVSDALEEYLRGNPKAASDPLAAVLVAMALKIDRDEDVQAAATFQKLMSELRGLAPAQKQEGKIDELKKRRKAKLGSAASQG